LFKAGSRRRVGANDPRQASRRPKYDHTHTQNTATSCRVAPVQPVGFESIGEDVWVLAQDQGWGLTCAAVCTSPGGVLSPQTPNARLPGRGIPPGAHKAAVPGPLVISREQSVTSDTSKTQVGRWILEWHSDLLNVTNTCQKVRKNKEFEALK